MNKDTYDKIIKELYKIPTKKEKCEYLFKVIEETDYDANSYNGELINLYNKYKEC